MKKRTRIGILLLVAVLILVAAVTTVLAAEIGNLSGQSCGDIIGTWHFVNNQTGGAPAGTLNATWSSGDVAFNVGPTKVLGNTQHFIVTASGTLLSASTNLPGKLVLSDFSCDDVKKTPPPK